MQSLIFAVIVPTARLM